MNNVVNLSEAVGLYSSSIDLGLRAGKALQKGIERLVREHLAYVESTVGQMASFTAPEQPKDFAAAQTAALEKAREQFATTAKHFFEIQQDVGAELKAIADEGVAKFSPGVVSKLFKAA